jgi:tetratricopeptide (TPR) repeat protein
MPTANVDIVKAEINMLETEPLQKIDDTATDAGARLRYRLAKQLEDAGDYESARALASGDERWLLTEALRTRGVVLARRGRHEEARASLERAAEVAESAGNFEQAGRAALTIIEELDERLSGDEVCAAYERAADLLASSQNVETLRRLTACARRALLLMQANPTPRDWDNFSFREAVLRYESTIIEKALRDAGGTVTRAAQMLGMKHHNNLISILNSRHRELLRERKPIVPRRRSIIAYKKR